MVRNKEKTDRNTTSDHSILPFKLKATYHAVTLPPQNTLLLPAEPLFDTLGLGKLVTFLFLSKCFDVFTKVS